MYICRNRNVIERAASSGRRIRGPYCRLCESSDYVVMLAVLLAVEMKNGEESHSYGRN
ncbi:unnamed protein product [Brassica rapa]|uniref:Uncharacterized protein n=2 Tax=Brassica TaxID=3705 RepID=A0A8D9H1G8_BRACM|nr:unnamed protein product [Brassica napus]CAG7889909.1 unnamed protein product [Brassica rapa]